MKITRLIRRGVIALSILTLLLVLTSPLISKLLVGPKYGLLADVVTPDDTDASAEIKGADPVRACGGTAGQYNWGEQIRRYVSLNGTWQVEEGDLSDTPPGEFTHEIPVPGLLNAAEPSFDEVGTSSGKRDAFWYRRLFKAPRDPSETALLCVAKSKYGIRAWLNGTLLGDHYNAFTQAELDVGEAIRWGGENELIIRVGADRGQVPPFVPNGHDHEKELWIPGLWDDVNLLFTGAQSIVRSKIETGIDRGLVTIQTTIHNGAGDPADLEVSQAVREWRGRDGEAPAPLSASGAMPLSLAAGETKTVRQEVMVPDARPWWPESPSLYVVDTLVADDAGPVDDRATRFGFRRVEWKSGSEKGFYLNGRRFILRGSNFTLHRFFEDPDAGTLAWDEAWVRKLFTSYPREYHWSIFRACIGRLPNFWYDVADEEGFLIDDEYDFWSVFPLPESAPQTWDNVHLQWSLAEMEKAFRSWIQESWNHPSIVLWSASNETPDRRSRDVIDRVRALDPTRQWENGGWQAPHGPDDPIDTHPYLFVPLFNADADIGVLEGHRGRPPNPWDPRDLIQPVYPSRTHPYMLNEYGWLWLNRDGSPTRLTEGVYSKLLGDDSTVDERREAWAYLHAGLTGMWRARREHAAVQHFTYLGHSKPGHGFTCDNFVDIRNLVMEPRWHEYSRNVWSPVAVYIDKWEDEYPRGRTAAVPLVLINDLPQAAALEVRLSIADANGAVLSRSSPVELTLDALGQAALELDIDVPTAAAFVLWAHLRVDETEMCDRRKVGYPHVDVPVTAPF